MTTTEFSQRLLHAGPGSPELAALAQDLAEDARYPARLAMRSLSSDDKVSRAKSQNVLDDLHELSLVALAGSSPSPDIGTELWVIRSIAEEMFDFRHRAAVVLKDLLENRRPATPVSPDSPQQIPPGTRVCDLAYVLLQRILHLTASLSAFFALSSTDRDKLIAEFQKSPVFRGAFEDAQ